MTHFLVGLTNQMSSVVASRRADARARLDMESDFVVTDGKVGFRQSFETVEYPETLSIAPAEVVDAARRILTTDIARGLSAIVHDTIVVEIGCSSVPLFAMGLFPDSLRCVDLQSTHLQHRFQDVFICLSLPSYIPLPQNLRHHTLHHSNSPTQSRSSQGCCSSTTARRALARSRKSVIVHLLDDMRLTRVHVEQAIVTPISNRLVVLELRRPYLRTLRTNE